MVTLHMDQVTKAIIVYRPIRVAKSRWYSCCTSGILDGDQYPIETQNAYFSCSVKLNSFSFFIYYETTSKKTLLTNYVLQPGLYVRNLPLLSSDQLTELTWCSDELILCRTSGILDGLYVRNLPLLSSDQLTELTEWSDEQCTIKSHSKS